MVTVLMEGYYHPLTIVEKRQKDWRRTENIRMPSPPKGTDRTAYPKPKQNMLDYEVVRFAHRYLMFHVKVQE